MKLIKPYYEIETEINCEKILKHIEKSARTCYKTEGKSGDFEKTKKFVKMLVNNGHHSTLEHQSLTVRFVIDRGVSHELVRHRLCAFSQESTRYCDYTNDSFGGHIIFIIPPWVNLPEGDYNEIPDSRLGNDLAIISWFKSLLSSEQEYKRLVSLGWSPQKARTVLPNSLKTEIVTTANLREWRHILKMRAEGVAGRPHPQMLEVMVPLLNELKSKIPVIFDDIKPLEF